MNVEDGQTKLASALARALRQLADEIDVAPTAPPPGPPAKAPPHARRAGHGAGMVGAADVYLAGCSALSALAARLQVPIFKIGATQQPLLNRQEDLRADRYAGAVRRDGVFVEEAGFDDWEMRRLPPFQAADEVVTAVPRALRVALSVPFPEFERALRAALRPRSLEAWSRSDEGRGRLRDAGIGADAVRRFTLYGYGDGVRSSACAELYVVRPRLDLSLVVDALHAVAA